MQLIYTSGTTGEPKGVMHSANTTMANIIPYAERMRLGAEDVILMASPMAHQTGFMYGLMMPIMLRQRGAAGYLGSKKAVELIRGEGVTFTMASTVPDRSGERCRGQWSGCALTSHVSVRGRTDPGPLVENARKVLGAKIVSAWADRKWRDADCTRR